MDGVGSATGGVLVLGATNVPWELDPAIRRRFEKRVYIALPEARARAKMFRLNLGDTPHSITEDEFDILGGASEGYSGSDIAVVVREALMEPLRKCQMAKQFIRDASGNFHPCEDYPFCPRCPMILSTSTPQELELARHPCAYCNAERMTMYDVPSERLVVPLITFRDFQKALGKAHSSVGTEELQRFVNWTEEFGQEGCFDRLRMTFNCGEYCGHAAWYIYNSHNYFLLSSITTNRSSL
jgi:vacuolar protein-sorting-associated protein 4